MKHLYSLFLILFLINAANAQPIGATISNPVEVGNVNYTNSTKY